MRCKMKRILIVEDDIQQLNFLEDCIKNYYKDSEVVCVASYDQGHDALAASIEKKEYFSLFALDLQLTSDSDDRGGFKLAGEIRKNSHYYKTPILFLTSITNEVMYAVSNYHCYNYLSKPYTKEDIVNQLEQLQITGYITNDIIFKDVNQVVHSLTPEDILFVESVRHNVIIHTSFNNLITAHNISFADFLEHGSKAFIRCHKRYLVNKNYINALDNLTNILHIKNISLPVGRTYKKEIQSLFTEKN